MPRAGRLDGARADRAVPLLPPGHRRHPVRQGGRLRRARRRAGARSSPRSASSSKLFAEAVEEMSMKQVEARARHRRVVPRRSDHGRAAAGDAALHRLLAPISSIPTCAIRRWSGWSAAAASAPPCSPPSSASTTTSCSPSCSPSSRSSWWAKSSRAACGGCSNERAHADRLATAPMAALHAARAAGALARSTSGRSSRSCGRCRPSRSSPNFSTTRRSRPPTCSCACGRSTGPGIPRSCTRR